jgi:uncharacterized protein (DUF697 family)
MGLFRRLPTLWRLLREVDLESIRREAERPFQVLVCAQEIGDAEELAARISGEGARHPWVLAVEPEQALRRARSGLVDVALLRTPTIRLTTAMAGARAALTAAGVPTVTVIEVAGGPMDLIARDGESARVLLSAEGGERTLFGTLVAAVAPLARVSLARQLPPLRPAAFDEITEETARANAVYALTMALAEVVPLLSAPLNLADIVVLTKNQLVMSYRIALAAGKQGAPRELLGELVSVIGGGFLFRQVGRELVGLMPVIGVVPKVAVAYAGTLAIARAVTVWASEGVRLSPEGIKRAYRDAWERGKRMAQTLVRRAPGRRARLRIVPRPKGAEETGGGASS